VYNAYLIEIGKNPVAIVKRNGSFFTFHALQRGLQGMEGRIFPDVLSAEKAAIRFLRRNSEASSLSRKRRAS
jgi:hypothetical protein